MKNEALVVSIEQNIPKSMQKKMTDGHSNNIMPVNFLHTPAQYSKMLIKYGSMVPENRKEKQIGIVRNLEFINQPLFEKERERRDERIHIVTQQTKTNQKVKCSQLVGECSCCCCDSYCRICAEQTTCKQSVRQSRIEKKSLLIDLDGMKRNPQSLKRRRKRTSSEDKGPLRCHEYSRRSGMRIEDLVTKTLLKEIESSRIKQLDKLSHASRKEMLKEMNSVIRENNLNNKSRPVSAISQRGKPTKKQVGEAYWESVKGMVGQELKKHSRMLQSSVNILEQAPKVFRYSAAQMKQMRENYGKQARLQEKKKIQKEAQEKREIEKKLQILDYKQKRIVQESPSRPFKPTAQMIEGAFQSWQ